MGLFNFFKNKTGNILSSNNKIEGTNDSAQNATNDKIVDSFLKPEKWAIVELLYQIAESDGLSKEEEDVLKNLCDILGFDLNKKRYLAEEDIYNIINNLNKEQKSYVSYMVFTMVVADGCFTKEENDEVLKLLSRTSIESTIIDDLFKKFGQYKKENSQLDLAEIENNKTFNKSNKKKTENYDSGAVKTEYYINSNGNYDGPFLKYYEDGKIKQNAFFIDGKQNYESDLFYENGKLLRRTRFIDDEYVGNTEEYYQNGQIKIVKSKLKGFDHRFELNLFDNKGNHISKLFFKEIFHENDSSHIFPGVILHPIQKPSNGVNFLPFGVWYSYDENNKIKEKLDFEITKPKDCSVGNRNIKFDYCSFELTSYKKEKITSRVIKPLNELNFDFFSNELNSIVSRSNYNFDYQFNLIEKVIKSEDYVMPSIESCNKEETINKLKVSKLDTNWINGFKNIFTISNDPQLASTAYVPVCYEKEQTIFHPLINQEITFNRGFMDVATYCEKDALKLINEIMIFNGGVQTFNIQEDNDEGYEVVFRSQTIMIAKSFGKEVKMPVSDELSIDAEINVITVTHLPPKNISNPYDNLNGSRGVHWDSLHINNCLLGLYQPVYCKLDGGIMDGRFHVMDDKRSDIIFSIDDNPSIEFIKAIVRELNTDNPILDISDEELKKIVDAYSLHNSSNEIKGYSPNLNLKKEDTILCFTLRGKLMVSLNLIQSNIYQTRIDKIADDSWSDLKINSNDEFDFYISELDDSKGLDQFNKEVKTLFIEFEKYFDDYDEFEFWDKYEISDIDLKYWLKVIKDRAGNKLMNFNEDKDLYQLTLEWIWGHADEYKARLENPHGDPYNETTFDHSEKIEFLKIRVVAFGEVYMQLMNLRSKINDCKQKYRVDVDTTEKHLNLEIAHAKSSLYGAIKYALNINISKEEIKLWFDDFEDNSELLAGNNPFDSINLDDGLAAMADNDLIKKNFNIDINEISKMSDEQLVEQLKKRGISYSGTRNELIVKLILSSNEGLLKSAGIKTNN